MNRFNSIFNVLRFNNRNWKAVVLCVFAATVFWFLNALNKTYTTILSFPLNFTYNTRQFVPIEPLPTAVRINVTGNGWDLFRRSTSVNVSPLEIPLERPVETRKIVGSTLPAFFSNQLEGLEINFVLADTIYVHIAPKAERWVNIRLDSVEYYIKDGYGLASNVSIMPDSILIEGPQPVISGMNEPLKIKLEQHQNIDDHFMEDIDVVLPPTIVRREPGKVAVMFNVEKLVMVEDSIRLEMINLPRSVWPVMGRRDIPVVLSMPQNMRDELNLDSTRAILDLKDLPRGSRLLCPQVIGLPPFTHVVKIDSVRVKF
jgi:hypothetical protein